MEGYLALLDVEDVILLTRQAAFWLMWQDIDPWALACKFGWSYFGIYGDKKKH